MQGSYEIWDKNFKDNVNSYYILMLRKMAV